MTANDGPVGDQHLRNFQDNEKTVPTVLTTSQKLSTGVDALNVRHIVLMRPIRSMIEFKQIIGRGTRTYEGKNFFTIWDFVKAHLNFSDPEWDGEPEEPVPPGPPPDPPEPPEPPDDDQPDNGGDNGGCDDSQKIVVRLAARQSAGPSSTYRRHDILERRRQTDLGRRLPCNACSAIWSGIVADEDQLRAIWSDPDNRERFLEQLDERGYDSDRLEDIRRLVDAPDSDLFDVLGYVLYANSPKTRDERADDVRHGGLDQAGGELRQLLLDILRAYETHGESELASAKLATFMIGRYGSVGEGKAHLGDLPAVQAAFRQMQARLYAN